MLVWETWAFFAGRFCKISEGVLFEGFIFAVLLALGFTCSGILCFLCYTTPMETSHPESLRPER